MIDSQPSASRPRSPRLVARRLMPRREPVVRRELVESAGWNNVRIEHEPDTELTLPLPTRILPSPRVLPLVDSEPAAASFTPVVMHARSSELSVVAFLSAVVTFGAVLFGQHAAHWGEARAQISERAPTRQSTEQAEPLATRAASGPSWAATLTSNIPVVLLRDLPLEHGGAARVESERSAAAPRFEVERGSTFRPAARASRAVAAAPAAPPRPARPIAASFRAPSPAPALPPEIAVMARFTRRSLPPLRRRECQAQFISEPRRRLLPLRSCILSAVARTRVTPFVGEPVTVSKSLSW